MRREYILAVVTDNTGGFVRQFLPRSAISLRAYTTPTAKLTVRDSHPIIADIVATTEPRCQVWMVSVTDGTALEKYKLLEGRIDRMNGDDAPFGTVTVSVLDDRDLVDSILGWQVPTASLAGQSAAEYAVYTGPTETRVKAAIQANVTRLGLPWDVVATRGKGATDRLELRMHSIASKIMPALQADRLILTVDRQPSGRWTVDVIEGDEYPRPITPLSGVLASWSWVTQAPTATRVVIGGRGEGTAREFKQVIDTAREVAIGYPLETYVDARQTEEGSDIAPSGTEKLAAASATSGVTATLRESSWFRFPTAYKLGDRVRVQVGALDIEDIITQIDITHDSQNGFIVVPKIGLATEDPQERLVGAVKSIATAVGGQERR